MFESTPIVEKYIHSIKYHAAPKLLFVIIPIPIKHSIAFVFCIEILYPPLKGEMPKLKYIRS